MSLGNTLNLEKEEVEKVVEALSSSRTCIIMTHRNADPDALASAVILYRASEALGCTPCIRLPEGVSGVTKRLLDELSIELDGMECREHSVEGSLLVVVDSSNTTQIRLDPEDLKRAAGVVLVDHHEPGDIADIARAKLVEPGAPSATQLALEVLNAVGARLRPEEATLALAGIIYDTKRFLRADPASLAWAARLIGWGGDYSKAVEILGRARKPEEMDFSERIARLKAAQRVVLARFCKDYIVAVTHVGSFESSAARALIDLGADVAVVVTPRKEEARVSVRVSKRAADVGVTAAALASYIAEKMGGRGGGHREAGMAHVPSKGLVEELVAEISKFVPGKAGRICVEHRSRSG